MRSRVQAAQRKHEELRSKYLRQSAQLAGRAPEGTALQRIAAAVPEGPLSLLRRAMQTQRSLRVVTRHARGVRGVATGEASTWRLSQPVQWAGLPAVRALEVPAGPAWHAMQPRQPSTQAWGIFAVQIMAFCMCHQSMLRILLAISQRGSVDLRMHTESL